MNIVEEICEWNQERGCTTFDGELEYNMLHEELNEYVFAYPKTITDKFGKIESEEELEARNDEIVEFLQSPEFLENFRTNQLDALGDLVFVAIGSMYKILGDWVGVEEVMMAIISANNLKKADKDDGGKIKKPEGFVGPEGIIKNIYKEMSDGQSE